MKILVSGYHNPNFVTITEYIEGAVSKLGNTLYTFDDRKHLFPKGLRNKVNLLNSISIQWINHLLLRIVLKHQPDLVLYPASRICSCRASRNFWRTSVINGSSRSIFQKIHLAESSAYLQAARAAVR